MQIPLEWLGIPPEFSLNIMTARGYQRFVQSAISDWLWRGKNTGFISADFGGVHIASAKGGRAENQDRAIFLRFQSPIREQPAIACIVLCDGMGGMQSGSASAVLAISTFASSLVTGTNGRLPERLELATEAANQAVYKEYEGKGGATLSAVACGNTGEWSAINIGDSRVYEFLASHGLRQISTDDTLENMLSDIRLSKPSPEFRKLVRYIGMGDGLAAQSISLGQAQEVTWFVLASDGAYAITDTIFKGIISHSETALDAARKITIVSQWIGGSDNSTMAILDPHAKLFSARESIKASSLQIVGVPGCLELVVQNERKKAATPTPSFKMRKALQSRNQDKLDHPTETVDTTRKAESSNVKEKTNLRAIEQNGIKSNHEESTVPQLDIEIYESGKS
jgi:serine/threonine protein phosphatase PrpC